MALFVREAHVADTGATILTLVRSIFKQRIFPVLNNNNKIWTIRIARFL